MSTDKKIEETANIAKSETDKIRENEAEHQDQEMAEILSDAAKKDPSTD